MLGGCWAWARIPALPLIHCSILAGELLRALVLSRRTIGNDIYILQTSWPSVLEGLTSQLLLGFIEEEGPASLFRRQRFH